MRSIPIAVGLSLLAIISFTSIAGSPDATGTWNWSVERRDGQSLDLSLVLEQNGEQLTGVMKGMREETEIQDGIVNGDQISFKMVREMNQGTFSATYTGTIKGHTITGKSNMAFGDRTFERDWSATREVVIDATGNWNWSIEGRNGETRESTLALKQSGSGLTGVIKSARGETEIQEGKIDGDLLSFKTVRENQRGTFTADYAGRIEGDTIAFKVSMTRGERSFEREWTAKREAAIDPTGKWAWVMKRDDGEDWESTLTLASEGGQLTGFFEAAEGAWRLDLQNVSIDGANLKFQTVFERDGNSMTIDNTATIDGTTMTGKSEADRDGESWSREWTATKQ